MSKTIDKNLKEIRFTPDARLMARLQAQAAQRRMTLERVVSSLLEVALAEIDRPSRTPLRGESVAAQLMED